MHETCETLGKIFIAGTGRSGTTLLHRIIGTHPSVYQVPWESKFIVEGDGLNALIPRLCDEFSISASDLALLRFMETMGVPAQPLTQDSSELDLRYADHIGAENYYPAVKDYLRAISDGDVLDAPYPKRFDHRGELITLTRAFIARLFGEAAIKSQKRFWVEKTPSNIIALDFLWELFPEAAVINIKRDPRGVLWSFMEQPWWPNELERAATLLEHIYWRWARLKSRLNLTSLRYREIKLEDLASRPAESLAKVAETTGLTPEFSWTGLDLGMVDRWKSEMPAAHQRYCETRLAPYFALMGYDI